MKKYVYYRFCFFQINNNQLFHLTKLEITQFLWIQQTYCNILQLMKQTLKPKLQTIKEVRTSKAYFKSTKTDAFKPRTIRHQSLQQKIQAISKANDNLFKIKTTQLNSRFIQKMKSSQQKRLKLPHLIMKKNPKSLVVDPKTNSGFLNNPRIPLQTLESTTTSKLYLEAKKINSRGLKSLPFRSNTFYSTLLPKFSLDQLELEQQSQAPKSQEESTQALWKAKNMLVCVKQMQMRADKLIDIRHNRFLKIFGTLQISNKRYAVAGEEANYSLKNLLQQFGVLQQGLVSRIMSQLVQGIRELHYHKLFHNNLSLKSIFYKASGEILIDISCLEQQPRLQTLESNYSNFSNFNIENQKSRTKSVFSDANYGVFLNYYNPPQVLLPVSSRYSQINKDIWSLGCITLELLHGFLDRRNKNHPYNFTLSQFIKNNVPQDSATLIQQINEQFQPIDYSQQSNTASQSFPLSDYAQQFVKHCLTINAEERPVIWQLSMFPFLEM